MHEANDSNKKSPKHDSVVQSFGEGKFGAAQSEALCFWHGVCSLRDGDFLVYSQCGGQNNDAPGCHALNSWNL